MCDIDNQHTRYFFLHPRATKGMQLVYLSSNPELHSCSHVNPNGTHLMSNDEFKTYYNKPTKTEKISLENARKLFCEPTCLTQCTHGCPTHTTPNQDHKYAILNFHLHYH